jgi:MFS transporter, FHS family, L-fucose permease
MHIDLSFESIVFPAIVALGIRGLGRHYKRGSGWIVGGVVDGACIPDLTGKVADNAQTILASHWLCPLL